MNMEEEVKKASKTRTMWRRKLDPTKIDEYIHRHNTIWPELLDFIKEQGVSNYSIFLSDNEVFGYLEHDDIPALTDPKNLPTQLQIDWEESMRPLAADKISDDLGTKRNLQLVFYVK